MKELLYGNSERPWTPEALLWGRYTLPPLAPTKCNTEEERHFLPCHQGPPSGSDILGVQVQPGSPPRGRWAAEAGTWESGSIASSVFGGNGWQRRAKYQDSVWLVREFMNI